MTVMTVIACVRTGLNATRGGAGAAVDRRNGHADQPLDVAQICRFFVID
jgi:hypothetical protein